MEFFCVGVKHLLQLLALLRKIARESSDLTGELNCVESFGNFIGEGNVFA